MIHAGASPKAMQTVLGHASAGFTLSVYGHLLDGDLDGLGERLEAVHGATNVRPMRDHDATGGDRAAIRTL